MMERFKAEFDDSKQVTIPQRMLHQLMGLRTYNTPGKEEKVNSIKLRNVEYVYDTVIMSNPNEPKTMKEVLSREDTERWIEVAKSELQNFYN